MIKKIIADIKRQLKKIINDFAIKRINGFLAGKFDEKSFAKKSKYFSRLGNDVGENVKIVGPLFCSATLHIGSNVFIGRNVSFEGNGDVIIGDNVDIAPNVVFNTGGHLIGESKHRAGEGLKTTIKVGSGTWIGDRSLIINNINIGKGNVVAAGSVVIKSTPDNVLVAGVPAIVKKTLK